MKIIAILMIRDIKMIFFLNFDKEQEYKEDY